MSCDSLVHHLHHSLVWKMVMCNIELLCQKQIGQLSNFLFGTGPFFQRWDRFLKCIPNTGWWWNNGLLWLTIGWNEGLQQLSHEINGASESGIQLFNIWAYYGVGLLPYFMVVFGFLINSNNIRDFMSQIHYKLFYISNWFIKFVT